MSFHAPVKLTMRNLSFLFMFILIIVPLWPQAELNLSPVDDPASYIGLTLREVILRFGVPRAVYPVRGLEEWQDDVVFIYDEGDFYIYKDRLWQAGLKQAWGIKIGDSRAVVSLIMNSRSPSSIEETAGDSVFYLLNDGAWPLMFRFEFDSSGLVRAIFIYRTDI